MQVRTLPPLARAQRGVSLIITLLMLVIIGLTAAAAMRSAVSSEKVINNLRSETLAQQYAEAALRYCEQQMALTSTSRPASLQDASIVTTTALTSNWSLTATWIGATPKRTLVPLDQFKNADSSFAPSNAPQCYVEKQTLADGTSVALVVTARGFSPDFQADSTTGKTTAGSVVWLQSTSAFN